MIPKEYEQWINPILKELRYFFIVFISENTYSIEKYRKVIKDFIIYINTSDKKAKRKEKAQLEQLDLGELIELIKRLNRNGFAYDMNFDKNFILYFDELALIRNDDAHWTGWDKHTVFRYLDTFDRILDVLQVKEINLKNIHDKKEELIENIYFKKYKGKFKMENSNQNNVIVNDNESKELNNLSENEQIISEKNGNNSIDQEKPNVENIVEANTNNTEAKNNQINNESEANDESINKSLSLIEIVEKIKHINKFKINSGFHFWLNKLQNLANDLENYYQKLNADKKRGFDFDLHRSEAIDNLCSFFNTLQTIKNRLYLIYEFIPKEIRALLNERLLFLEPSLVIYDTSSLNIFQYLLYAKDYEIVDFEKGNYFSRLTDISNSVKNKLQENIYLLLNDYAEYKNKNPFEDYDPYMDRLDSGYYIDVINYIKNNLIELNELIHIKEKEKKFLPFLIIKPALVIDGKCIQKAIVTIEDNESVNSFYEELNSRIEKSNSQK